LIEIRAARTVAGGVGGAGGGAVVLLHVPVEETGARAAGVGAVDVGVAQVVPGVDPDELDSFIRDVEFGGGAGDVEILPRPGRTPATVVLVGLGAAGEAGWRAAGAALVRAGTDRFPTLQVPLPAGVTALELRSLVEGATLAAYRYRLAPDTEQTAPRLGRITLVGDVASIRPALAEAAAVTDAVVLARDLTNTPSREKSPAWFVERLTAAAARRTGITVTDLAGGELEQAGFGGIVAVGSSSSRPPRLLSLSWNPRPRTRGAKPPHVVLVGKGITFDSGGISMKSREGMALMRKDMGGAAAVTATVLAVADLGLPVRVTALAALAENLVSGSAMRPGDVITHYGGTTVEVQNTDAEGRLVLADALAYAEQRLAPDVLIDLATLTGAAQVALGKRRAALFTPSDELAAALTDAGTQVDEPVWRMPLPEEYVVALASDVADLTNMPLPGGGAITAALFLREFTGAARPRWAHIDMSGPSWIEASEGILSKGATGWGVRLLVRWLTTLA
jgi:leucyl aminopeptidase